MSVKELVRLIESNNIAENLSHEELLDIGKDVCQRFEQDKSSMSDWMRVIDDGLMAIEQDGKPKSEPFDNAANYKSTIIPEAATKYGDRVKMEILNHRNLVKGDIIGKDPENEKQDKMDRVSEYMNYDVNHKIKNWRDGQEKIAYRNPLIGSMFKKTSFDPLKGRNKSEVIDYPNFAVHQETESMEECRSFTIIRAFDKAAVEKHVRAGIWLDAQIYNEQDSPDKGSNQDSETTTEGNENKFLEQYCYVDINNDGIAEPVAVLVHRETQKVVRITANYSEDTIFIKHVMRVETFARAASRQKKAHAQLKSKKEFEFDYTMVEAMDIEPSCTITHYRFMASRDGTFLGIGYFHELANLQKSHNMATNQLLDAGTLHNLGGGFVAKGFRKKMGLVRARPQEWTAVDIDPVNLKNGIAPFPTKEPSQTLYALKENLSAEMRNFTVVTGDEASQIQGNTAPTTALAMLFESGQATSALLLRFVEAMGDEFRRLFDLSKRYVDPIEYREVLDDEEADFELDFNNEMFDIIPVANPEMSSRMQKIQLASAEMEQFDRVLQAGGNPIVILKSYFEAIDSDHIDAIFPEQGQMTPEEEQQIQAMTQAQQQANEIASVQVQLLQQQVENGRIEAQSLAVKRRAEIEQIIAKISEIKANTTLKLEQAETEEMANQITKYTASIQAIQDSLTAALPQELAQ